MTARPDNLMKAGTKSTGFTLLEVILSMGILALLSASVYAVVSSSISASRAAMEEQLTQRRLSSFLQVTRDAFLNLPGEGTVSLRIAKTGNGEAEPQLVLGKVQGLFGMPSLGGGSVVLAARPRSDGTRTMILLRIPANTTDEEAAAAMNAPGIPLLPKVRKPRWTFLAGNTSTGGAVQAAQPTPVNASEWSEEWPDGSPRPGLVRLEMEVDNIPDPVVMVFYLPSVTPPPAQGRQGAGGNTGPQPQGGDTNNQGRPPLGPGGGNAPGGNRNGQPPQGGRQPGGGQGGRLQGQGGGRSG